MTSTPFTPPPFRYFFAGLTQVEPGDLGAIPEPWRARFDRSAVARTRREPPEAAPFCAGVMEGPGGARGLMAAPFNVPTERWRAALGYDKAAIRDEVQVADGVWIMVSAAFEPEQVMRRSPLLEADASRLRWLKFQSTDKAGAAMGWFIPCCLPASKWCLLPMTERLELGRWVRVPTPDYRDIAAIAERYYRAELDEEPWPTLEWMRTATCAAFAVNYEITPAELGALGVLQDATYLAVASLLTDRAARDAERDARAAGKTTSRAREHALWRDDKAPEYVPTAADLDLAGETIPEAQPPTIGRE